MTFLTGIILGIIQGITEWLPISSEAVITLFLINFTDTKGLAAVNTSIWLHTGTMIAALIYFRKEFQEITLNTLRNPPKTLRELKNKIKIKNQDENWKLTLFILYTTLITGTIGGTIYILGLKNIAGNPKLLSSLTGLALFITGLTRLYGKKEESKNLEKLNNRDTILTGILQAFSILPGISRSGITSFALLYRKFEPKEAFRLSFIISVPAVLAANIGLQIISGFKLTNTLIVAGVTSAITGYLAIDLMLKIADKTSIAYICFALAILSFTPLII